MKKSILLPKRGIEYDHAHDNDDRYDDPDDICDLACFLVKKHLLLLGKSYKIQLYTTYVRFSQKRQIRKVMYSRITLFVLFIIVLLLAHAAYSIYGKEQLSAANYAEVKKEYDDLKSRQTVLQSQVDKLNTESGMEEEIRDKFSVAKPGETVVVLVDGTDTAVASSKANKGLWQRFLDLFK